MKKILIVNASKRRKGNSYALENRIAQQLEGKAEVSTFNIGEKDVRVCLACDGCKRHGKQMLMARRRSRGVRLRRALHWRLGTLFTPQRQINTWRTLWTTCAFLI